MNKGYMIIEVSLILPLIAILLLLSVSLVLFTVIRNDADIDMNLNFMQSEEQEKVIKYEITLPLMGKTDLEFSERKKDVDYGVHIQRSKIINDIFAD